MRYEHVLRRHKSRHWPNKVVVVCCSEVDASEVDQHGLHTPQLAEWSAIELRRGRGRYEYQGSWSGTTVQAWWDRVRNVSERTRSICVVSAHTSECWSMLGLWDQLESGVIGVYPRDYDADNPLQWAARRLSGRGLSDSIISSVGAQRSEIARCVGYLVLSDPPLIARIQHRETGCWINWTGGENYGMVEKDGAPRASERVRTLAESWRRYYDYCTEHSFGKHCATAGSQANYGWRYGHYHPGCATHSHPTALAGELASYHSGRAEAYQLGPIDRPLYYADVRSAYLYHCRVDRVPIRLRRVVAADDPTAANGPDYPDECIARVTVRTAIADYPYRIDGGVIWPVGTFQTWLAGPELTLAYYRRAIVEWHEWSEYVMGKPLASAAEALWQWRCNAKQRGHDDMLGVCKLMYVSLVGSLAKRQWEWERYHDPDNDVLYGEWIAAGPDGAPCRYRAISGIVEREVSSGLAPDTLPFMAAWITSAARVRLSWLMDIAGRDNVYYCDTDAIMVDADGKLALEQHDGLVCDHLGGIGFRWGPADVCVMGVKFYSVGGKMVCSGIPEMRSVDVDGSLWFDRRETAAESVRKRRRPSAAVRTVGYVRDSLYRHGDVHSDGRITPYVLGG